MIILMVLEKLQKMIKWIFIFMAITIFISVLQMTYACSPCGLFMMETKDGCKYDEAPVIIY